LATGFIRDVVFFDFPTAVPLVPENLYVFGIKELEGATYFIGASSEGLYPRGRAVLNGSPVVPGFFIQDFYFREGSTTVPEPATVFLLATGCLALFGLGRFTRR